MNASEDKLLEARLSDMTERCERYWTPVYSTFLDERQSAFAEQWLGRNSGGAGFALYGGYEGAMRKMLAVFPEQCAAEEGDFPMKCLTLSFRPEDKITHRDVLGSFMAQQLKREVVGDILTGDGIAQVFVTDVAAKLLMQSVTKIGRVGIKLTDDREFCLGNTQEFKQISGTVASLRLDCVVSLAAGISREKAASLIRSDKVGVNHFPAASVSQELREGDILSVRGCGRFILYGIDGLTKKNRIHIDIRKFI
jgi:RNA-binding protein YlmH